nr:MAG TPA: Type II secretion system protein [Inoviridae sp.]
MKKTIVLLAVLLLATPAATDAPRVNIDVGMTVAQLVKTVYDDAVGTDYVLEPEVLEDKRRIGVRMFDFRKKDSLPTLLNSLGYRLENRGGVDYVSLIKKSDDYDFFVYRPKHKSAAELKTALSGLFGATVGGDGDRLIFKTSVVEIEKIKSLLKRFDVRPREVVVRGKIFEVTTKKTDASSLSIIADVFKKAGLAVSNGAKLVNYLSFKDKRVNAYWSALSGDDRFKLLSEPSLRIKSNTTASLTVGNDVPTLGSVTYQDGQPVQSVTYRSSGIIFEITPEVLDGVINLSVRQELSNFAETTSGVNNSPTLVKREIKTNISANSAELIILGGLIENKNTASTAGLSFLPAFLSAKSNSNDKTEIILSLYVEILPEK